MIVETLVLGELDTNCYLLRKDSKVIVIDPADEVDKIINKIGNDKLVGIIITHNHFDHVGALKELRENFNAKVYARNNLLEKTYNIEGFNFKIIYTPGHTDDSISIYFEKERIMFVGDFIFKNSIGRTDLGGNMDDMINSISVIKKYKDITVYPGHGEITNIESEKNNNYYFKK